MDEYIGVIKLFAGNYAPVDYMFCNGQELPVSQYQALFSILGFTFGGNGASTFKLPDLRGRVPLGVGSAVTGTNYTLAQNGGQEAVALNQAQLPAHTHTAVTQPISVSGLTATTTVNAGTAGNTTNDPTAAYWGKSPASGPAQAQDYTDSKNVAMASDAVQVQLSGTLGTVNVDVGATGGGAAHNNMQPFLALNYIICVNGLYPPRP